MTDIGWTHGLD